MSFSLESVCVCVGGGGGGGSLADSGTRVGEHKLCANSSGFSLSFPPYFEKCWWINWPRRGYSVTRPAWRLRLVPLPFPRLLLSDTEPFLCQTPVPPPPPPVFLLFLLFDSAHLLCITSELSLPSLAPSIFSLFLVLPLPNSSALTLSSFSLFLAHPFSVQLE